MTLFLNNSGEDIEGKSFKGSYIGEDDSHGKLVKL